MGKYMRRKGVGKMAVLEGSLGVRTRARAQALERGSRLSQASTSLTSESLKQQQQQQQQQSQKQQNEEPQDAYMELRSRRLEKAVKCTTGRGEQEEVHGARESGREERSAPSFRIASVTANSVRRDSFPYVTPPASSDAAGHARDPVPQVSLQSSVRGSANSSMIHRQVKPSASTQSRSNNSVSLLASRSFGIMTRNQKQELAAGLASQEGMDVEMDDVNAEVEPFFGESPMIAGPSNQCRYMRYNRENTPDSSIKDTEAPGSTSRNRDCRGRARTRSLSAPPFNRANEAPSCSEIEAFFKGAEQRERRRFIERFNFDPANERPLRGRYEWISL